jgi:hypothetical protein
MFKVEFRYAIGAAIPSFIELLKSNDYSVSSSASSNLIKVADKGE